MDVIERILDNVDNTRGLSLSEKMARFGDYRRFAIGHAAKSGHLDVVKRLIAKYRAPYGQALAVAAKHGHRDIVDFLLEKGPRLEDINLALAYAAKGGQRGILGQLVDSGANEFSLAKTYAEEAGHLDIAGWMEVSNRLK